MGLTNPEFKPTEEQIRHHNSVLASEEYVALAAMLREIVASTEHRSEYPDCPACVAYHKAKVVLDANKLWTWTGTRGPVE